MSRAIQKGATDQSVVIRIIDAADGTPENGVEHNTSGIDLWYRREGAAKVSITEAALAALDSAHSDGGIELIGDGYYRLDLPDAAVATGANGVTVGGTVTGMLVIGCYVPLVDYNPQDAVRLGLTALPNAAAEASGGLPTLSAAQGSNGTINVNVHRWLTGTPNALQGGRVDSYIGAVAAGVIAAASFAANALDAVWSTTTRLLTAGTNIVLAKGTGVTGFNDLSAVDVRSAVGLGSPNLDTQLSALATLIAALNDVSAADVLEQINAALDTTLSATIPADGTRPTLRQAVYMTTQFNLERSVDGTTVTVKNPDGTTLMTLTLNSASAPTVITRAS